MTERPFAKSVDAAKPNVVLEKPSLDIFWKDKRRMIIITV